MKRTANFLSSARSFSPFNWVLITMLALTALIGLVLPALAASGKDQFVVFNANWCASCREVLPIVRDVASQNGIMVREIDVDDQRAPSQARQLGLDIPSNDPPQVYLIHNGGISLVLDGRNFQYGKPELIRSRLLQNLQRSW
jgi:thiol-disulfide isomerase/thioredoxin